MICRRLFPRFVGGALALLALTGAPPAEAQRVVHRVRFGETLASIADHYYGKQEFAAFIRWTNGRDDSPLQAGERILVPTAWHYTVPKTTTLPNLAQRLLGDRRRALALAAFNRAIGRRRRVRAGRRLLVPFTVNHLAQANETFAGLSTRYYGDSAKAGLVARFNYLKGTQPPANARLQIPIGRVRILARRLEQLTNVRLLGVSPRRQQEDRAAVQEANALLRRGAFWQVPLRLVRLLAREHPSDTYIADVFRLLATAYVAVGQEDLAVRSFREALLRQPTMTLDPVTVSPKVIRAFAEAKTRRHGGR